jgi:hypothetical protein
MEIRCCITARDNAMAILRIVVCVPSAIAMVFRQDAASCSAT